MVEIEGELHAAHLAFLHEMATKLTDEQWQKLHQRKKEMMMQRGEQEGGSGHHPGSRKEAEEFFKKK